MTAGILIKNDYGTIQIDETYSNLHLITKYTISAAVGGNTLSNVPGSNAVMAFNSDAVISGPRRSGDPGNWTFSFYAMSAGTVYVYIFDNVPSAASIPNYGIIVKNASGGVTFHQNMQVLRIADFKSLSFSPSGSPVTYTYSAGRVYAIIASVSDVIRFDTPGAGGAPGSIFLQEPFYNSVASGFSGRYGYYRVGLSSLSLLQSTVRGQVLIVDVTGY